MKKFEELSKLATDTKQIKERIEYLFARNIKCQSHIGKWFVIDEDDMDLLYKDISFVEQYTKEFGYVIEIKSERVVGGFRHMRFITIDE